MRDNLSEQLIAGLAQNITPFYKDASNGCANCIPNNTPRLDKTRTRCDIYLAAITLPRYL